MSVNNIIYGAGGFNDLNCYGIHIGHLDIVDDLLINQTVTTSELFSGATGDISGTMTPGTIPLAVGSSTIGDSNLSVFGPTLVNTYMNNTISGNMILTDLDSSSLVQTDGTMKLISSNILPNNSSASNMTLDTPIINSPTFSGAVQFESEVIRPIVNGLCFEVDDSSGSSVLNIDSSTRRSTFDGAVIINGSPSRYLRVTENGGNSVLFSVSPSASEISVSGTDKAKKFNVVNFGGSQIFNIDTLSNITTVVGALNISSLNTSTIVQTDSSKNLITSNTLTGVSLAGTSNVTGTVNMNALTGSTILQTDSSKNIITSNTITGISLAGTSNVTGTMNMNALTGSTILQTDSSKNVITSNTITGISFAGTSNVTGTMNMNALSASTVLQTNSSKNIITSNTLTGITLSGTTTTGLLQPTSNAGADIGSLTTQYGNGFFRGLNINNASGSGNWAQIYVSGEYTSNTPNVIITNTGSAGSGIRFIGGGSTSDIYGGSNITLIPSTGNYVVMNGPISMTDVANGTPGSHSLAIPSPSGSTNYWFIPLDPNNPTNSISSTNPVPPRSVKVMVKNIQITGATSGISLRFAQTSGSGVANASYSGVSQYYSGNPTTTIAQTGPNTTAMLLFSSSTLPVSNSFMSGYFDISWNIPGSGTAQATVTGQLGCWNGGFMSQQTFYGTYTNTIANMNQVVGISLILPAGGSPLFASNCTADIIMNRL